MQETRNFAVVKPNRVVGLCDRSSSAGNAAIRAVLLAQEIRASAHLLYPETASTWDGQLPCAISRIVDDAGSSSAVTAQPVRCDSVAEILAGASDSMMVIPCAGGNPVRQRILGTPAERLIRLARSPVLVVKRPVSGPYARVLAAVDLREHSERLLAAGASLAPGARMAVFHSLVPASRSVELAVLDERPRRREGVEQACDVMDALLVGARDRLVGPLGRDFSMFPVLSFGTAAETILAGETAHAADLIVIGKSRQFMLAAFLLGGVTQRVLARCEADVLIVPMSSAAGEQQDRSYNRTDADPKHSMVG